MRVFRAAVLPALVCLVLLAHGHNATAVVQAPKPSAGGRGLVLDAVMQCGVFDGKFQCKPTTGGKLFGKGAGPGGAPATGSGSTETAPGGVWPGSGSGQAPQGAPADPSSCQGGMVGTPPNCQCPESSELLGGNCVHYTASSCSKGLAAGRSAASLPRRRRKTLLQTARRRIEGLLLRDLRQVLSAGLPCRRYRK